MVIFTKVFKSPPLITISQSPMILKTSQGAKKSLVNPTKRCSMNHTVTTQLMSQNMRINHVINKNKFLSKKTANQQKLIFAMIKNHVLFKNLSHALTINQSIRRSIILVINKPHQSNLTLNKPHLRSLAPTLNQFIRKSKNKVLVLNKIKFVHVKLKKPLVKNKNNVTKKKYQNKQFIHAKK